MNPEARNSRQAAGCRAPRGRDGRRAPASSRGGSRAGCPSQAGSQVPDKSLDGASGATGSSASMLQRGNDAEPARGRGRSGAAL